jgi:hypothetical protein
VPALSFFAPRSARTLLSACKNRFPEGVHRYAHVLRAGHHSATFADRIAFWRAAMPGRIAELRHETRVANPADESRRQIAA